MTKIAIVLGPRPEIIKLAPIIQIMEATGMDHFLVDTGQHAAPNMNAFFYGSMGIGRPHYWLDDYQFDFTSVKMKNIFHEEKPGLVLVQGDTDTTLIGALAAVSEYIPLAHVEAGLRCGDLSMREEQNRIAVDHMAQLLFTPTENSNRNLMRERISVPVFKTGHTIADVILSRKAFSCETNRHILLTLHRRETVDDGQRFHDVISGVERAARKLKWDVIFPVHPRTDKRIQEHGVFFSEKFKLVHPMDFDEFLRAEQSAALIMTDSGGIQEEACILGVPCVTLRENTERPETIDIGANMLAGYRPETILECARTMAKRRGGWKQPFGDGHAGEHIVQILETV